MQVKSTAICHAIASQCIASRVRRLSRVITAIYDEALRPHGITLNQLNTLVFLMRIQKAKLSEIAKHLHMEISTASRNLNRMRKGGLILVQEGKDARTREFSVSKKGEEQIKKAFPDWQKAQRKTNTILGKELANAVFTTSK
jgi:DNA-binding MarR family transcriptional regulator